MKICYLSDEVNHVHDHRFLTKLVEKGYETYFVSIGCGKNVLRLDGLKTIHFKLNPFFYSNRLARLSSLMFQYSQLKRLLNQIKPDVLHAGWIQTAGLIAALSKFHPFLLMPWGSDILLYPSRSRFYRKLTQYVIQCSDMVTCDAETVKRKVIELANYPAEKIVVFPWGIDLRLFHPSQEIRNRVRKDLGWDDKKILIMTREFRPICGVEYFIKAIPEIIRQVPEVRVLLAGSGSEEQKLHKMVKELKLENIVCFLGYVPNHRLPSYLNAADIYVSSSLSDGSPTSLLEAMACGLPVMVTRIPSVLEWIKDGENGLVVPLRDSQALAEKIVYLIKNEDLMKEMSSRNLAVAKQRADWDKNFNKLEMMYEKLTNYV